MEGRPYPLVAMEGHLFGFTDRTELVHVVGSGILDLVCWVARGRVNGGRGPFGLHDRGEGGVLGTETEIVVHLFLGWLAEPFSAGACTIESFVDGRVVGGAPGNAAIHGSSAADATIFVPPVRT